MKHEISKSNLVLDFLKVTDNDICLMTSEYKWKKHLVELSSENFIVEAIATFDHQKPNEDINNNEITVKKNEKLFVLEENLSGFWKVMIAFTNEYRGYY